MSKIQKIKETVSIIDLLNKYGANCDLRGKCKHNPLRQEKTCSLVAYPETNTYNDFGDDGGDVIDFVCKAEGIEVHQAIEVLMRMYNIDTDDYYTPNQRTYTAPVIEKDYIKPEKVESIFEKLTVKFSKTTRDTLFTICPEYVFKEAKDDDKVQFFNIVRYYEPEKSPVVLLPNEKGISHTFRYRYKIIDEVQKKWVAHYNTKSNYAYCNLNENPFTLVVEGSRDYLSALLCGYSVIALPSAGFKPNNELFKDRLCIFIDDDDGKNAMKELYESAICEKIFFNHTKFKEITKCNSKDFSDYLYQFDNLEKFKHTFEKFIYENEENDTKNWQDDLVNSKTLLTIDALLNAPDAEWLIDNFILKQTLTVIHSKAGAGKTSLLLGLLKKMIKDGKIDNFIYFDADNPLTILKNRLSKLIDTFGDKMIYHSHTMSSAEMIKDEMKRICLYKGQGKNTFIVIDTLGKFVTDVSSDVLVKPMLDLACELRDKFGATVVIVHHSNKATTDDGDVVFRGSSTIAGDIDFMWGLRRTGSKIHIKNDKGRLEYFEKIEANVDLTNYDIELKGSYEIDEIIENEEKIKQINNSKIKLDLETMINFIGDDKVPLNKIKLYFKDVITDKSEVSDFLKSYTGKYFKKDNGKTVYDPIYSVISNSPTITVFDESILADIPDF